MFLNQQKKKKKVKVFFFFFFYIVYKQIWYVWVTAYDKKIIIER